MMHPLRGHQGGVLKTSAHVKPHWLNSLWQAEVTNSIEPHGAQIEKCTAESVQTFSCCVKKPTPTSSLAMDPSSHLAASSEVFRV